MTPKNEFLAIPPRNKNVAIIRKPDLAARKYFAVCGNGAEKSLRSPKMTQTGKYIGQAAGPASLTAKSSMPENAQKKPNVPKHNSSRPDQEPAVTMQENVRQDVKTQSHRIHFTYGYSKALFYLVGFEEFR